VAFVHPSGSFEEIAALLSSRRDHFMPVSLLESQLNTLEPLEPDENGIVVQLGQQPQDEPNEVIRRLGLGGVATTFQRRRSLRFLRRESTRSRFCNGDWVLRDGEAVRRLGSAHVDDDRAVAGGAELP
jgi:hypothetical protein